MNEPIKIHTEVATEDSRKYPDICLRLLIRQAVLDWTGDASRLTIDEAQHILQEEADYLQKRIRNAS